MPNDVYLTAQDVADLFKLNVETVYQLIAKKELPGVKIGGQWRFEASEIRAWFRDRSRESSERTRA